MSAGPSNPIPLGSVNSASCPPATTGTGTPTTPPALGPNSAGNGNPQSGSTPATGAANVSNQNSTAILPVPVPIPASASSQPISWRLPTAATVTKHLKWLAPALGILIGALAFVSFGPTFTSVSLGRQANRYSEEGTALAEWSALLAFKQDCESRAAASEPMSANCTQALAMTMPPPPYTYSPQAHHLVRRMISTLHNGSSGTVLRWLVIFPALWLGWPAIYLIRLVVNPLLMFAFNIILFFLIIFMQAVQSILNSPTLIDFCDYIKQALSDFHERSKQAFMGPSATGVEQTMSSPSDWSFAQPEPQFRPGLHTYLPTPILECISKGGPNIAYEVEQLLANGASADEADNLGTTALMSAAYNGMLDVVELLILKYGADVNRCMKRTDISALHMACVGRAKQPDLKDCAAICRLLIGAGADVNHADWTQRTALHRAMSCNPITKICQLDLVSVLLEHGAIPDVRDEFGKLALTKEGLTVRDLADHGSLTSKAAQALQTVELETTNQPVTATGNTVGTNLWQSRANRRLATLSAREYQERFIA